jgi:tetratricopeptide (TPR) repeat protein
MRHGEDRQAQVARLNLRGVSAINRNERDSARAYFEQAYKLDPNNAFTLNNMGYLAEMDGDQETASFYYEKAQLAPRSDHNVEVATRRDAEGRPVGGVATVSDQQVSSQMEAALEQKRRQGGPVVLRRRDNSVVQPEVQPPSSNSTQPVTTPSQPQSTPPPAENQNLPASDQNTAPQVPQTIYPPAQQNPPPAQPIPNTQQPQQ